MPGRLSSESKRLLSLLGSLIRILDVDLKYRKTQVTTRAIAFDDFRRPLF